MIRYYIIYSLRKFTSSYIPSFKRGRFRVLDEEQNATSGLQKQLITLFLCYCV